jgi:plastocyanin
MWRIFLIVLTIGLAGPSARAGTAEIHAIVDGDTGALKDAVIYATPLAGLSTTAPASAIVDQIDKLYVPFVSAIQAGATVSFPNKDDIKHHLYSVSAAKRFERPLYKGEKAAPVLFDKPGEVVLGCNIHDWMIAHILVLETPYSAVTNKSGRARITGMPAGDYAIRVWHPGMKDKKMALNNPRKVNLGTTPVEVKFKISLRPKKMWAREKPENADKEYSGSGGFVDGN